MNMLITRITVCFSLMACLFLGACGTLTVTNVDDDQLKELHGDQNVDLDTEVNHLVGSMVSTGYTPGAVAGILLPDGSMHFYGYGVADKTTGRKPDANTLFAVGSISKGFLAAITAQFVNEGQLSWSDTLPQLMPAGTQLSPDASHITLYQLATHTSGLPRQPITAQTLSYFVEYLFDGETFYPHINHDYIMEYLKQFEADEPGTIRYSNIGYGLIAEILQKKSGQSMDELLKKRMIRPLKLTCTGYVPAKLPCNTERAYGYAGDSPWFIARGNPTPDWDFTPFMNGAAALHSTAHDLLTFAAAHLDTRTHLKRILNSNLRMRVSEPGGGEGIGWTIEMVDGEPIEYEIGLVAGYTSYVGVDAAHKTAVVLLQNSFNWDSSAGHKLLVYLRHKSPNP